MNELSTYIKPSSYPSFMWSSSKLRAASKMPSNDFWFILVSLPPSDGL